MSPAKADSTIFLTASWNSKSNGRPGLATSGVSPGTAVMRLDASGSGDSWTSLVEVPIHGPRGSFNRLTYGGPGGDLDPGESGTVRFDLANVGDLTSGGVTATMSCGREWMKVTDADGSWGSIGTGSAVAQSDLFAIDIAASCLPGHLASLTVTLVFAEGGTQVIEYPVTVGTADERWIRFYPLSYVLDLLSRSIGVNIIIDPAAVQALVQISHEIVEQVVWEVVPELAEELTAIEDQLHQSKAESSQDVLGGHRLAGLVHQDVEQLGLGGRQGDGAVVGHRLLADEVDRQVAVALHHRLQGVGEVADAAQDDGIAVLDNLGIVVGGPLPVLHQREIPEGD